MFSATQLLTLLILTTPIGIIFDGPIIHDLVTAVAAISLAIVSVRMRPGEAGFLSAVIWPLAVVASGPALWMLIQVLPLQIIGLANPIWESAATALGRPLAGSISIDPGATFISFIRYVSVATIVVVAAAVAVDRRRAEWLLLVLVAATTVIALMSLVAYVGDFTFLSSRSSGLANAATDCEGLGVILAGAGALHMFEYRKKERPDKAGLAGWYLPTLLACCVALVICFLALIVGATSQAYFAFACGLAILAAVVTIRHFSLGPWGIAAIASITLFIAIAVVLLQWSDQSVNLTLKFATQASPPLTAVTQRILSETSWFGTGAGTFAAVLPIYQGIDELSIGHAAPTAAARLAVEIGQPFLGAIMLTAVVLVAALLRGALRRVRDCFYSTAGASCILVITILTFSNAALFRMPVLTITAVVAGLAIAQSRSRVI
jgi:hypothetical protein